MRTPEVKTGRALMLLAAGLLATLGAMAEKPDWAGGGKHGKPEQSETQGRPQQSLESRMGNSAQGPQGTSARVGGYFSDNQRTVVRNYYGEQYRVGHCPPGLAKKNNGCMPPGQARKWAVGQPLPRDLAYYSVPQSVVIQLGVPPAGQRYVRVAADILLLSVGTGMVIDAIQDLGGM